MKVKNPFHTEYANLLTKNLCSSILKLILVLSRIS